MSTVGLFGAFERHNFGDWLMGFCAQELLGQKLQWLYDSDELGYGINSECGHYNSLNEYLENESKPTVIHTGGQTIGCPPSSAMKMNGGTSTTSQRPHFYMLPEYVDGLKVRRSFFSIGGSPHVGSTSGAEYLRALFNSSEWVSVRESKTSKTLKELGVEAHITPDLVSLVKEIRGDKSATKRSGVLFQLKAKLLELHYFEVLGFMKRLLSDFSKIKIIAAGVAPGHDSWQLYARLASDLREAPEGQVELLLNLDPLAIVDEVSSAQIVVASSLHMRIVAMAYEVPRVSLFVEKTLIYAQEWDSYHFFTNDLQKTDQLVDKAMNYSVNQYRNTSIELSELAKKSWKEMVDATLG